MKLISGDTKLSSKERFQYLLQNFAQGIIGHFSLQKTQYWFSSDIEKGNFSPGRKYIDSFLRHQLKEITPPRSLSVLDIGCGTGYIRQILVDQGFSGNYVGVDVQDYFKREDGGNFSSTFVEKRIEDFESEEKFDLIISNTALEHIENDTLAIEKCRNFLKEGGVAVHLVPSSWALFLYLFHGYRQYSRRRIAALFSGSNTTVYRLGGIFSFLWHFFLITLPAHILRKDFVRKFSWYEKAIPKLNRLDKFVPLLPCIYIIVEKKK